MALWIKDPLAILADGAERGVVVEGGRIVECIPAGGAPTIPVAAVFEAGRHVVIPGLINAHHHFYQTLTRAFPPALNQPLFGWLTTNYPVWARLTPHALRLAARVAYAELLLSGCTTASDHHYVYPAGLEQALDIEVEEAAGLGIRVVLTRGAMSLSVEDGGLPPASVVQKDDVILADFERVVARHHQRGEGATCVPFSVARALMRETAEMAQRLDVRLHTHLAETHDEDAFCEARFGMRPLDYLEEVGWLNDRVWLAHGIHFQDAEIARLGRAGTGICHCPTSNMIISSGICRVPELEAAGAPVGLGVDGAAAQDCSNLIQEVRQGFLLRRVASQPSQVTHLDALRWATRGSAACLGRADLGVIAPGKAADLALFTLDELRFSGAGDPLAALVICGAHRADRVMVNGRWVVEDGAIPGLDLAGLIAAHSAAARAMQAG
ncbi:MAG: 8-oxoguanine deaminase [Alphaproteobacteria bacterium]|nr:8-oxoguanine deaminase [Alphaproteobacteria bacterium]